MFNQLSIIGCGLIGSSIFKALKKKGLAKKLITFDNDESVTKIIKKEKLTDKIVSSLEEAVQDSQLVLISTPLSSFETIVGSLKKYLKPGTILTDTNSVKKGPNEIIKKINLKMFLGYPDILFPELKKADQSQVLPNCLKIDGQYFPLVLKQIHLI